MSAPGWVPTAFVAHVVDQALAALDLDPAAARVVLDGVRLRLAADDTRPGWPAPVFPPPADPHLVPYVRTPAPACAPTDLEAAA